MSIGQGVSWVAIAAVVVSAAVGYFSARRAQYDRVLDILAYVSSAHIAAARHQMGLLVSEEDLNAYLENAKDFDSLIADYFTVMWAIGRVDAVRESLPQRRWWKLWWRWSQDHGPQGLLKRSLSEWIRYWGKDQKEVEGAFNTRLVALRRTFSPDPPDALNRLRAAWLTESSNTDTGNGDSSASDSGSQLDPNQEA